MQLFSEFMLIKGAPGYSQCEVKKCTGSLRILTNRQPFVSWDFGYYCSNHPSLFNVKTHKHTFGGCGVEAARGCGVEGVGMEVY